MILAHCNLSDVGLRPLFQALPGNANLRLLCIFGDNEVRTSEFAVEVLDAVRQNTLLEGLSLPDGKFPELDAASAFMLQRSREKQRHGAGNACLASQTCNLLSKVTSGN